jgi:hypothetical protein
LPGAGGCGGHPGAPGRLWPARWAWGGGVGGPWGVCVRCTGAQTTAQTGVLATLRPPQGPGWYPGGQYPHNPHCPARGDHGNMPSARRRACSHTLLHSGVHGRVGSECPAVWQAMPLLPSDQGTPNTTGCPCWRSPAPLPPTAARCRQFGVSRWTASHSSPRQSTIFHPGRAHLPHTSSGRYSEGWGAGGGCVGRVLGAKAASLGLTGWSWLWLQTQPPLNGRAGRLQIGLVTLVETVGGWGGAGWGLLVVRGRWLVPSPGLSRSASGHPHPPKASPLSLGGPARSPRVHPSSPALPPVI